MNQVAQAEFFGTPVSIIDHAGKHWLTAEQVGLCLDYGKANARQGILKLYDRHADEFTDDDTGVVKLTTPGGIQPTRIFSSIGCIKLGFFSNTAKAKDFRTWAAKVLDTQPTTPAPLARLGSKVTVTRRLERQVFEAFVAGLSQKQIRLTLNTSEATVNLLLNAKYRFSPDAGEPECGQELLTAVAARHMKIEHDKLLVMQERIAQKFLAHNHNQELADLLDNVGQMLQTNTPLEALRLEGGGV